MLRMKRAILITAIMGALLVLAFAFLCIPVRFRLASWSPSGAAVVQGLAFQGSSPHALDETLRLFVRDKEDRSGEWTTKIQTHIRWDRNLEIIWRESGAPETFAIRQSGEELMEFVITEDGVECTSGWEFLAPNPVMANQPMDSLDVDQGIVGTPGECCRSE